MNPFHRSLVVAALLLGQLPAENAKPNIIIIIADDLNDSIEGMGGHPQAKTPHLDRLAGRGVRFQNAACNAPLCGPSRASIWSGIHPHHSGLYGYDQQDNHWNRNPRIKDATTLFEHFAKNGYRIYATGKIHHNGHEVLSIFENPDGFPGFGRKGNFGPLPNDGEPENKRHGVLPPWFPANLRDDGFWGNGFGPIQDLSTYGEQYRWTMFGSGKPWHHRHGHDRDPMPDEVHAEEAIGFLKKQHDKPFLMTIGFSRPHSPLYAPKEYFDRFPLDGIELAPIKENDIADCAPILVEKHDIPYDGWKKYEAIRGMGGLEHFRRWTQAYLACVAFVDDQVGRILDGLADSPYADNTIIIFTSDHGYHMGEKQYLFKMSPWEESARVPLVIAGPGVAAGVDCVTPVSLIDLYPTCTEIAGIPSPAILDGFSMRPLLANPAAGKWNGPPVSLTAIASNQPVARNTRAPADQQHFTIRSERYRYIRCRDGSEELYDHSNDPHEWTNLASLPEHRAKVEEMRALLGEQLAGRR